MSTMTHEQLLAHARYCPDSGLFTYIGPTILINGPAGKKHGEMLDKRTTLGYTRIGILGGRYLGHRLAVFHMTGKWPAFEVDHINGIKSDNRYLNLREATSSENRCNRPAQQNSRTGVKGVHLHKQTMKWRVRVNLRGINYEGGLHEDIDLAGLVASELRRRVHGEFANHRGA